MREAQQDALAAWQLRRAGLLDVAYIYELALAGSEAGAYSANYLSAAGRLVLLRQLLALTCLHTRRTGLLPAAAGQAGLLLLRHRQRDCGFVWLQCEQAARPLLHLHMFSIDETCRGSGHGRALLDLLKREAAGRFDLQAECTIYAKIMKRLLRRSGFQRRRQSVVPPGCSGLDVYCLPAQSDRPAVALSQSPAPRRQLQAAA